MLGSKVCIRIDEKQYNIKLEENTESEEENSPCLDFLDIIISSVIIGPIVIAYWRGTWNLLDDYLCPEDQVLSALISFFVGVIGFIVFSLSQDVLRELFCPDKYQVIFYIVSRLYTFVFGLVSIAGWRGPWLLEDIFIGEDMQAVVVTTVVPIILLIFVRGFRNLGAAPFFVQTDFQDDYFGVDTMFKTSGTREPGLYVLDCIFSVLVVGTLVVVAWRGVWVLLDITLYPENKSYSAWGSLVIGYGIVAITFALQPVMRWTCDRLTGFWRIAVADIFLFLSFIGTVNVWRGVWMLLDVYFLPDNRILSDWLTHGISFILLALLNCSNSVLVRGVYIDAEEPAGQCVVFPIYYIRLFFQKERTKKQRRLLDALERQDKSNANMFLLDKSQTANNIKIVKSNSGLLGAETKSMINLTNERAKNGDHNILKE